jgi:hypothetical protein
MNRLRDDVGEDPVAERGIDMLRAIAATPSMPDLKRRVWGAIQQQRLRAPAAPPLRRLRVAAVVAVVLCLAGTAGAVLSQRWIKLGKPGASPIAKQATGERTPTHARTRARAAASSMNSRETTGTTEAVEGSAPVGTAAAPSTSAAVATAPSRVRAPASAAVPSPRSLTPPTRKAARTGERSARASSTPEGRADLSATRDRASERERIEVLDALVALRRDRDPERAGRLLGGYLDAHPHGVLREEALALGIEAAAARGDAGVAQRLARAYQSAYPGGRFGAFARQHTDD